MYFIACNNKIYNYIAHTSLKRCYYMATYFFVGMFLCVMSRVYAMDLEMVRIKPKKFEKLPLELHIKNWPMELQQKVAENIIDLTIYEYEKTKECIDQEKWKKYNLNELLLAVECAQEFHTLQKMCQHKIGGKKFLAQELFALPRNQRDVFMRMANRSCFKMDVEGNVSLADYSIIRTMENEHITRGLVLSVLKGNKIFAYMDRIGPLAVVGGFCGLFIPAVTFITPGSVVTRFIMVGFGMIPMSCGYGLCLISKLSKNVVAGYRIREFSL